LLIYDFRKILVVRCFGVVDVAEFDCCVVGHDVVRLGLQYDTSDGSLGMPLCQFFVCPTLVDSFQEQPYEVHRSLPRPEPMLVLRYCRLD
jgi:hypothetical protein